MREPLVFPFLKKRCFLMLFNDKIENLVFMIPWLKARYVPQIVFIFYFTEFTEETKFAD